MLAPPVDLLGRELHALGPSDVGGDVGVGWAAFADLELLAQMAVVLVLAIALAAVIAYHPIAGRQGRVILVTVVGLCRVVVGTDTQVRKHDAAVCLLYRAPATIGRAQLIDAFARLPAPVRAPIHWA